MALKIWLPLNKDYKYIYDGVKKDLTVTGHQLKEFSSPIGNKADYNVSTTGNITIPDGSLAIRGKSNCSASIWAYNFKSSSQLLFFTSKSYFAFGIWNNAYYLRTQATGDGTGTTYGSQRFIELGTPPINTWIHYAITFDNGTAKAYVNGDLIETKKTIDGDKMLSTLSMFKVGGYNASYPFSGYVCDFRVYDNTLTEEDVKRIYQQKLFELIPYSGVKYVLFDRSGFMNMPLVNKGASFQNNALYFNGSAKLRPKEGNVGFTMDDGTLSVWFTIETASTNYQLIYIDSVSKFAIGIIKSSNTIITTCNGTGSKTKFTGTSIKYDGSVNNIIVSYNTGKTPQFMLINGVSVGTNGTDVWTESSGLTIGNRMYNSAQSGFKGKLLKVGVYNRQFTQDEAVELYNSERGMFLPDDYIQLEYIQSNGTQYIDTGINGFNSGDWEIYCEWMSVAAPAQSYGYIFGVYEGENYNSYRLIHKTTSTTEYYVSAKSKAGGGSILLSNIALNAKHSIKIKNGTFTCDGVSYTASTTGTSLPSANTMLLFKSKNNLYSKCRIYSTWAKKDGILKYNMIPAKRKSDNVIGMYDMVSRQFFTNSGSGSFTGA